jgi:CDP-diacylglycerol--glycerol-3-phosphate 3-phosphatidyltransferase
MLRFVPNIFTLGRLVLTVIFVGMVLYSPKVARDDYARFLNVAFVLFVIAGLTDIVDGIVARKLNVTSKFGRIVDPLVDKILVCGTFICFALIAEPKLFGLGPAAMAVIHWSVAAVLIAREVYVTVLRHMAEARGIDFAATVSGKIKMFLQSFAIGTVIIKMAHVQTATWGYWFTTVVFALMLVVTVISGLRATQRSSWKQAASS